MGEIGCIWHFVTCPYLMMLIGGNLGSLRMGEGVSYGQNFIFVMRINFNDWAFGM